MKRDERRVSPLIGKLLKCVEVTHNAQCLTIKFVDREGLNYIHYQVDPETITKESAKARAISFLSRLGKSPVGKYFNVLVRIREMDDGKIYSDVDKILDRISRPKDLF